MRVKLVNHTPKPAETIAAAAKTCRALRCVDSTEIDDEAVKRVINFVKRAGHESVFEHASFTFSIDGVSRACTHQLVRHRIASYSQQSQRYVDLSKAGYVLPEKISGDGVKIFKEQMKNAWRCYKKLLSMNVPAEDARYVLPNATRTSIVVTMNARELFHFLKLRLCERTQWEIRELARRMLEELKAVAPLLFEDLGPLCKSLGYCPEAKSCGLMPTKAEVL